MRKPDPEIWNRRTVLAVFIEFLIALNIDIYGSSYTFWLKNNGLASLITISVIITTIVDVAGWIISGFLVDRFGTKRVQFVSLSVLLLAGIAGAMVDGFLVMCCLFVRFLTCGIALIANTIQVRGLLQEEKQGKGVGQLYFVVVTGAVLGAAVGTWLSSEHQAAWRWLGPILTIMAIVALKFTHQSNQMPEKASIRPDLSVFRLVFPVAGMAITQGVLVAYVMVDLGILRGSMIRIGMYAGTGLAGWIVPYLLKHTDEKTFIRFGLLAVSMVMLFMYWPNMAGLMLASLVIGIVFSGIQGQILGTKVFFLTDQKGRATSTNMLVSGGSRIIGIYGLGVIRAHVGEAMWLTLPIILLLSIPAFQWTFRHCSVWNK